MLRQQKWLKIVAAVLVVAIAFTVGFFAGMNHHEKSTEQIPTTENTTTTETTTAQTTTTEATTATETTTAQTTTTQQTTTTEVETTEAASDKIEMYLCYSINGELQIKDITKHLTENLDLAAPISLADLKKISSGSSYYVQPELRVYVPNEQADISVVYESELTKASRPGINTNEGVSNYWYWTMMVSEEKNAGQYSLKVTITQPGYEDVVRYCKFVA